VSANSLLDLYMQKLQMIYDAEHQALEAMPQLSGQAKNERLRTALEQHRGESEEHVRRLQQLFQVHDQRPERMECASMRSLIEEAQSMMAVIDDGDSLDAFIIGAEQAVEHHEMAAYGTARTWAAQLGFTDDADLLQRTLDEEGKADEMLTSIAERSVNRKAAQGAEREVEVSGGRTNADMSTGGRSTAPSNVSSGPVGREPDAR
jgi:ferritin-like metal-binding protein YciE